MKTPPWITFLAIIDKLPENYLADNWADRVNICYSCDRVKEVRKKYMCGECYCMVDKKTLIKTEKCPLGKW